MKKKKYTIPVGAQCHTCHLWVNKECEAFTVPYFAWNSPKIDVCWGYCGSKEELDRRNDAIAKYKRG